ncbi:small multi-drug export protein [Candidatus Uhrbacteria bacterium]|nr:small multi-drug export protein [Candidatus Uhrbacteria bacterium]
MTVPDFLLQLPDPLVVFVLAATPIGEIKFSIPVAVGILKMPGWSAYFWSVIGNAVPILAVYGVGDVWLRLIGKYPKSMLYRLTHRVLQQTCRLLNDRAAKYGAFALPLLVGIGAWTASLAAFVFCIPLKRAFPLIMLGVIVVGLLTLAATQGAAGILT